MAGETTTYETLPDGRTRMTITYPDGHTSSEVLPVVKTGQMPAGRKGKRREQAHAPGVDTGSLNRSSR